MRVVELLVFMGMTCGLYDDTYDDDTDTDDTDDDTDDDDDDHAGIMYDGINAKEAELVRRLKQLFAYQRQIVKSRTRSGNVSAIGFDHHSLTVRENDLSSLRDDFNEIFNGLPNLHVIFADVVNFGSNAQFSLFMDALKRSVQVITVLPQYDSVCIKHGWTQPYENDPSKCLWWVRNHAQD